MTDIIKWDLADLYDNDGAGMGPFGTGTQANYGVYTITNSVGVSYPHQWDEGLKNDRNCYEFKSSRQDRINALFSPYGISAKQFIVVNDPSVSRENLLLMYPLTVSVATDYSFNMKPLYTTTPNKVSTVISSSIWPPNTSTTNLTLSYNIIHSTSSSIPIGTNIGILKTCNIDTDDFSYSITGGADASKFSISGNNLLNVVTLDSNASYTISIQSTAVDTTDAQYIVSNTFNILADTVFTKTDNTTSTVSVSGTIKNTDYPAGWIATDIKSVYIGNSVTEIDNNAFHITTNMSSVFIPNSVTSIGTQSFEAAGGTDPPATGLASVTIPSSVNTIGEYAFSDISNLETVTIYTSAAPANGGRMFFNSHNIKTVTLDFSGPIANELFNGREYLTSLTMSNVTSIGESSFGGTTALTSVTIPNTVISIGVSAFQNSGLTGITIPNSVMSIGDNALQDCSSLNTVTFEPNSNPSSMSTITFNGLTLIHVYMNSNTLDYLNTYYGLYPLLKNDSNFDQSFFGATNVAINSSDPPPPPPPPPPISNRPGPINFCNSRFAKCNINKKLGPAYSNGNVTIQGATKNQRIAELVLVQSSMRNAKLVFTNAPVNQYGRRSGGPGGSGASPKNTF